MKPQPYHNIVRVQELKKFSIRYYQSLGQHPSKSQLLHASYSRSCLSIFGAAARAPMVHAHLVVDEVSPVTERSQEHPPRDAKPEPEPSDESSIESSPPSAPIVSGTSTRETTESRIRTKSLSRRRLCLIKLGKYRRRIKRRDSRVVVVFVRSCFGRLVRRENKSQPWTLLGRALAPGRNRVRGLEER